MSQTPKWLPPLVLFEDSGGDWNVYAEALYESFLNDFRRSRPNFRGLSVGALREPMSEGKDSGFWHLVSEGRLEDERTPDMRRCERIAWPKASMENSEEDEVLGWENERGGDQRILLWVPDAEYLVVLAQRRTYFLLKTAYPVTQAHRIRKLRKEYEAWKTASAAP